MAVNHWVRIVMNQEIRDFFQGMQTNQLDALEISGGNWHEIGFKTYRQVWFPEFDICEHTIDQTYDVIIADQVFQCVKDPDAAAQNVLKMLRPGGVFVITVSFLIRYAPCPLDLWRWSPEGLKLFLEKHDFSNVRTSSWGNRECVIANFGPWVDYDPSQHSLENDPELPACVWGFAFKG